MLPISLKEISKITNGTLYGNNKIIFNNIVIDTKNIVPNCVYIALVGKKFDAHEFIPEAIKKGIGAILVEKKTEFNIPQIVVPNTLLALGKISAWIRKKVETHIIGLTGSCGKTSVKEMTASILSECGKTLSTYDNFNNHIGVPITLLKLTHAYKYAVIELGASSPGEIAYTANLASPHTVLINNIYHSHLQGFKSLQGVASAKQEILNNLLPFGTVIINKDSNNWSKWKKHIHVNQKVLQFSIKKNSNIFASNIRYNKKGTSFIIHTPLEKIPISLKFLGYHNIANALAATTIALSLNIPLYKIKSGLLKTKIPIGRLQPININSQQLLINDTYNSNVGSMIAAIKVLDKIPSYKLLIAGDMSELGSDSIKYHKKIGKIISKTNINKIFTIGYFSKEISNINKNSKHFYEKELLIHHIKKILIKNKKITVLIKGSRSEKMEIVVQKILQDKKNVTIAK